MPRFVAFLLLIAPVTATPAIGECANCTHAGANDEMHHDNTAPLAGKRDLITKRRTAEHSTTSVPNAGGLYMIKNEWCEQMIHSSERRPFWEQYGAPRAQEPLRIEQYCKQSLSWTTVAPASDNVNFPMANLNSADPVWWKLKETGKAGVYMIVSTWGCPYDPWCGATLSWNRISSYQGSPMVSVRKDDPVEWKFVPRDGGYSIQSQYPGLWLNAEIAWRRVETTKETAWYEVFDDPVYTQHFMCELQHGGNVIWSLHEIGGGPSACRNCWIAGCLSSPQFPRVRRRGCERRGGAWMSGHCPHGCLQPGVCNTKLSREKCLAKVSDYNAVQWMGD